MEVQTAQQIYNKLAEEYQGTKKRSILNILECGKILFEAKESMAHGMFGEFLNDTRVSESERTSQRLMSIFKDYRHLLSDPDKRTDAISHLGVSHLLELRKLPKRFRKEIEIIREEGDKEVPEIVEVIDEERLGDFLSQTVDHNGETKSVRDLPLSAMKKYIKEAQGIYEPEDVIPKEDDVSCQGVTQESTDDAPADLPQEPELVQSPVPKMKPSSQVELNGTEPEAYGEVVSDLPKLSGILYRLNDNIENIDTAVKTEISDIQLEVLVSNLKKTKMMTEEYLEKVKKCIGDLDE